MGMMKELLMSVEELVCDGLTLGLRTSDEIYSYVYIYERRADKEMVELVLENIVAELDECDLAAYNQAFQ